jgi:transitional endoplasmic reticulum ATPase
MAQSTKKTEKLSLRIAEAEAKDVGRGVARIDPLDMEKLGLAVGDIIRIEGKNAAAARLMPTYPENRGKGLIQADGIIRENIKAGLDEKVKISPAVTEPARRVLLRAVTGALLSGEDRYWGKVFDGVPVLEGNKIRAVLFGSRTRDFEVIKTTPSGTTVVITSATTVEIEGEGREPVDRGAVSYEDIGGLSKEIQRIREMVELPLKYPEVFERLGIDPPKGVLLYGPPGTGKTLIARAVAHESEANFFTINGPEIVHKFYGESEKHLKDIFDKAGKEAPSIIFIDEIDSIAPKRTEVQGDVEKRIVATLLSQMDGLKGRGQVIVIGATNIPDVLDPALRRPGRFDREIRIGIPDRIGRHKILEIHTRGMPTTDDVDLKHLADITHGYVGADLEALAREAAMICLREVFNRPGVSLDSIPQGDLLSLQVTMAHFADAMKEVEPSGLREIFVEVPNVRWDDVGGLPDVKKLLREVVEWPLKYEKLFEHAHVKPPKGILLFGPPGTGKTLVAKALANESGVNFISVKGPELMNKFVGESEKGIREVFKRAKAASPCIIFFDEMDSIAGQRGATADSSGVAARMMSQLLTEMDGVEELKGVTILGATNRKDLIDPAVLRSGRFEFLVNIPRPDAATRAEIFAVHMKGRPVDSAIDKKSLAEATDGFSGADIESLCREAAMAAMRRFIDQFGEESKGDYSKYKVTKDDMTRAIMMVKEQRKL